MKFITATFILFFSIIIGLILLTTVSLIPQSLLKNNFVKSAEILISEGQYPSIGFPFRKIVLDNFSDTFQLNIAYSINEKQPLKSAISAIWYAKKDNPYNQIDNLSLYIQEKNNLLNPIPYERYWHGYLIFLRPLLTVFAYSHIRIAITAVLFFLVFLCIRQLWTMKEKGSAIALIIGLLYVDFLFITKSLHFSIPFIIGLSMLLFLFKKKPQEKKLSLIFLFAGILTAYFDVLTTPLVTFGLLWFGVLILYKKLKTIKHMVNGISWTTGYSFMWVSKWIIAEITYMPGAFRNALNEVLLRTSLAPDKEFSRIETIKRNLLQLIGYDKSNKIFLLALCIAILLLIILLLIFKYISFKRINLKRIVLFGLLAFAPYVWYFFAANHSYMHVWFTYRDQLLTVIGVVMILVEVIKKENNHSLSPL